MRVTRIHIDEALAEGGRVLLDATASNHLLRVLRLRVGAPVVVFNGRGGEYHAVIDSADQGKAALRIGSHDPVERESPLRITLAQGVSRGERMDYTLQKSVELGVDRIIPLTTEFSQVRLDGARLERRMAHWSGVIGSACEQSGRTRLPVLEAQQALLPWLAALTPTPADPAPTLRLVLDPRGEAGLTGLVRHPARLTLLIGPEGGLSAGEIAAARAAGFIGLRLGPRILRTETAAVAALAALQALLGDLGG